LIFSLKALIYYNKIKLIFLDENIYIIVQIHALLDTTILVPDNKIGNLTPSTFD